MLSHALQLSLRCGMQNLCKDALVSIENNVGRQVVLRCQHTVDSLMIYWLFRLPSSGYKALAIPIISMLWLPLSYFAVERPTTNTA